MKKLLFLGLVFGAVTFASCSKEYNCECNGSNVYGSNWESGDVGYSAAKTSCESSSGCSWVEQ